jgi:hypothetical protein
MKKYWPSYAANKISLLPSFNPTLWLSSVAMFIGPSFVCSSQAISFENPLSIQKTANPTGSTNAE